MLHSYTRIVLACALVAVTAAGAAAAAPNNLRHAKILQAPMQGTLSQTVRALSATIDGDDWIGYSVEARRGVQVSGGVWNNGPTVADLSRDEDGMTTRDFDDDEDGFEITRELMILQRVNNGHVDRLRLFTDDCEVKASGTTVQWLGAVPSSESIELLAAYASTTPSTKRQREKLHSRAVSALAMHADPEAVTAMEKMVDAQEDDELRGEIVFWVGGTDSPRTVDLLMRVIDDDPSEHVREQAVFALSNNDSPEATDALIATARKNDDRDLRSKALFWLAQKAGELAKETLRDAAVDDPDQYVKEQAVFALSQLPEDEGVPLLIDVARTNKNSKVREQAIFWLGQSDDPRALTFFEEILSR